MTVSTTDNTIAYTGNNSTTAFAFPYLFYDEAHLVVTLDGAPQTITTHYTVTGEGVAAGGTVTFVTPPGTGVAIVIQRVVPYTQATDLENFDGNPADVTEKQLDLLAMMAQQLSESEDRSIKIPVGESTTVTLPAVADRINEYIGFDGSGNVTTSTLALLGAMAVPSSSTDNAIVRFDGAGGSTLQNSGVIVDDSDNITGARAITPKALNFQDPLFSGLQVNNLTTVERDAVTPSTGDLIWNETTLRLEYYSGSAWDSVSPPNRNLLYNGDFRIAQRGTTFTSTSTFTNSDDTYLLDRWILLSDGNDIVDVTQNTSTVPTGAYSAIRLDVETANKKAGILQLLEGVDSAAVIGGTASLSFKARQSSNTTVDKVRAAVISWDSTEDVVTSDVVSAWGAEGADPTLATNWTYENTPSDLTLTDSYQTFTIEGISVDTASTKNVGVFIWIDNDDGTVGDLVYIADVKLEASATATDFVPTNYAEELNRCKRYFQTGFDRGVPGVVTNGTTTCRFMFYFQPGFRVSPTAVLHDTTIRILDSGAATYYSATAGTIGVTYNNKNGANLRLDGFTGLTAGEPMLLENTGDENPLSFDGEM